MYRFKQIISLVLLFFGNFLIGSKARDILGAVRTSHDRSSIAEYIEQWKPHHGTNVWELSGLYEGDIMEPSDRNGVTNKSAHWPLAILPYRIEEDDFTEEQILEIRRGINAYRNKTCLKFRPLKKSDSNWIEIRGSRPGCWSSVGMQGGAQIVNLQTPNCVRLGVVIHELMHASGFYHQQSSSDRDDYVKILWENIESGREHNFKKYNENVVTNYGIEYDYQSIMHYSALAFSKNGQPTIEPRKENVTLGQRKGFSESDALKLNKMYDEECKKRKPESDTDDIDWDSIFPWWEKNIQD